MTEVLHLVVGLGQHPVRKPGQTNDRWMATYPRGSFVVGMGCYSLVDTSDGGQDRSNGGCYRSEGRQGGRPSVSQHGPSLGPSPGAPKPQVRRHVWMAQAWRVRVVDQDGGRFRAFLGRTHTEGSVNEPLLRRRLRCPKVNRVRTAPTSHPIPRSSVSTCSTCTRRLSRSRTGGIATPWRRRCFGEHHLTDDTWVLRS